MAGRVPGPRDRMRSPLADQPRPRRYADTPRADKYLEPEETFSSLHLHTGSEHEDEYEYEYDLVDPLLPSPITQYLHGNQRRRLLLLRLARGLGCDLTCGVR